MPNNPVIGEHRLLLPSNPLQFHALDSIQHMPSLKYEIQLNEFVARFQTVFCELCPAGKKDYRFNSLGLCYYFPLDGLSGSETRSLSSFRKQSFFFSQVWHQQFTSKTQQKGDVLECQVLHWNSSATCIYSN